MRWSEANNDAKSTTTAQYKALAEIATIKEARLPYVSEMKLLTLEQRKLLLKTSAGNPYGNTIWMMDIGADNSGRHYVMTGASNSYPCDFLYSIYANATDYTGKRCTPFFVIE